jgi:dTDP-4-dehydrorhamnose reductase
VNRWLVTGAGGMLGHDIGQLLRRGGEPVTALARGELDVTDPVAVAGCIG